MARDWTLLQGCFPNEEEQCPRYAAVRGILGTTVAITSYGPSAKPARRVCTGQQRPFPGHWPVNGGKGRYALGFGPG